MIQKQYIETVVSNEPVAQSTWRIVITCSDEFLKLFRPGQFAHIKIPRAEELLLRRPISISHVDRERKQVHMVYGLVGKGTTLLSQLAVGETLDVLMPLGNGYRVTDDMKKIWVIGGGMGVAPLRSLPARYPDREYTAFLGFRSKDFMYSLEEFEKFADTIVMTDDGTCGKKGFCTEALAERLETDRPDVILACGPLVFFKTLARVAGDVPVQVSMEQHMGCGVGGCATCVCKIGGEYRRVCVEGPVFDIREVGGIYD